MADQKTADWRRLVVARFNNPPPRLTAVKGNRQHWGRRLDKFRVKYELSERDLVQVLDRTLGKSAVHDLLSGECAPRMEEVIKGTIASKLRQFLKEKHKKTTFETECELLEVFREPICTKKENEPVLTKGTDLPKSAQSYFGLSFDPFDKGRLLRRNEIFRNAQLDGIAATLEDAINYQGFVALIGEVGSGKTEMQRRLVQSCENSGGKQVILWCDLPNIEQMHSASIASFILGYFEQSVPRDRMLRAERLKKLLAGFAENGKRIALGFDDCHRLDPRLLTALKRFWEFGSGGYDRYLGLLLFGQPKFEITLQSATFREISERLKVIHLPAFKGKGAKAQDAWDYVEHRVKIAGGKAEKLFDRDAVAQLAGIGPTPLAIGNLCNAALLEAQHMGEKKVHKGVLKGAGLVESGEPKVRGIRTA